MKQKKKYILEGQLRAKSNSGPVIIWNKFLSISLILLIFGELIPTHLPKKKIKWISLKKKKQQQKTNKKRTTFKLKIDSFFFSKK